MIRSNFQLNLYSCQKPKDNKTKIQSCRRVISSILRFCCRHFCFHNKLFRLDFESKIFQKSKNKRPLTEVHSRSHEPLLKTYSSGTGTTNFQAPNSNIGQSQAYNNLRRDNKNNNRREKRTVTADYSEFSNYEFSATNKKPSTPKSVTNSSQNILSSNNWSGSGNLVNKMTNMMSNSRDTMPGIFWGVLWKIFTYSKFKPIFFVRILHDPPTII